MSADFSTANDVPTGPSAGMASGEAKPVKQGKMVYCETCGYSLNSETQATAHYSGKSHLKHLKKLKHGNVAKSTFRPYKPRPTVANNWSAKTQTMTHWGTELQQPRKTRFGPLQTNFRFGSPNALPSQSFEQNQTMPSLGYSFNSFQSISSNGNNSLQSTRYSGQSTGPFGQVTNPPLQTNLNPVAKAVMDNFLGILPTKRRKVVNCHVCGLTFNSDSQAEAHFQGAKHQRKVKVMSGVTVAVQGEMKNMKLTEATLPSSASVLWCAMCHISVNSQKQLDAHNQGMTHKMKMGLIESGQSESGQIDSGPSGQTRPWAEVQGHKSGWFFCSTCNISAPTSAALGQHVLSAEHINKKKGEVL